MTLSVDRVKSHMPAKDIYHDAVKNALIHDNWLITHDPLHLKWGKRDMSWI